MQKLNKNFRKGQLTPIDNFFEDVLYNKKFGYYSNKLPFGEKGDFITAPSVSFLFGEMIAIWIFCIWENLNKPKKINIIELGPGDGTLSKTLNNTFKKFPDFYKSLDYFLYEKSKKLRDLQKNNLGKFKIQWISDFKKIKKNPVIFIGNEFFDAIPIKQYEVKNKIIFERFVKCSKKLGYEIVLKKASKLSVKEIKKFKLLKKLKFIEFPRLGFKELKPIIKKIKILNGGILLIDYGFINQQNSNTLQSVMRHKKNNIFNNLGNADITSLVNFRLLKSFFNNEELDTCKIVDQEFFLKKLGIINRAEILSKRMNFKDKADLFYRMKRLLDPKLMGESFKVIFAHNIKNKKIVGFY